jgi:membrane protein
MQRLRAWFSETWTVLSRAAQDAREEDITTTAQALAYSLFLAIPAVFLVLLGLFSIFADPSAVSGLMERARTVMPAQATTLLQQSLDRATQQAGRGVVMTVVGLLLGIWTTTSAATTLMKGITSTYDRDDERGFVHKRLVALGIVVALALSAVLVFGLLVLGPHLERWIGDAVGAPTLTAWVWWTAQWPILVVGLLFAFAAVLYLGPDVDQPRWNLITPGALTALVVWLVASGAFAFYASHFGSYDKTWGTLSAVIVTLVWLWLTSAALLFGAEVNAQTRKREAERELGAEELPSDLLDRTARTASRSASTRTAAR